MDTGESFGEQLRRHREAAGLTQEELAERAAISVNAVGALERGERRHPYPDTVRRLAEALALTEAARATLSLATRRVRHPVAAAPPVVMTQADTPCDVPEYLTPLVGRDGESAVALQLLARPSVRLLTLVGPGGVGKTRLAAHMAREARHAFPDGVQFVPLASVRDPALVLPTIAQALGVREGNLPLATALTHALRDRCLLLVLDNCEQIIAAAPAVADLLLACPHLKILATSRAAFKVRGEQEYRVPPLALPPVAVADVHTLAQAPAVALFVARVQAAMPAFALTDTNAASVAAICRRLDGLPLALELAAARVRLLSLHELLARLDCALPLLTGGPRDLPERQRTMRDTIAWSYDLLAEGERALFRHLAPFRGGWDLAAAEATALAGADSNDTLERLATLVDQSLVVAGEVADSSRYRFLEPVHEYAREALEACGEADDTQRRHAEYYLALAECAGPELEGSMQGRWLDRLEREHDNMCAAIGWMRAAGRHDLVARLGWALHIFWAMRGHHREGRHWIEEALASHRLAPATEARALGVVGLLARMHGDYGVSGDRLGESLARFRALGDTPGILVTISRLGHTVRLMGDLDRAQNLAEEGLALARAAHDRVRIVWMLDVLGLVALTRGAYAETATIYAETLPLAEEVGDTRYIAAAHTNLGLAALAQGRPAEAGAQARAALALNATVGVRRGMGVNLDTLASVAAIGGEHEGATRLFAVADALREADGLAPWTAADRAIFGPHLLPLRAALGEPRYGVVWSEGQTMALDEAVNVALAPNTVCP